MSNKIEILKNKKVNLFNHVYATILERVVVTVLL